MYSIFFDGLAGKGPLLRWGTGRGKKGRKITVLLPKGGPPWKQLYSGPGKEGACIFTSRGRRVEAVLTLGLRQVLMALDIPTFLVKMPLFFEVISYFFYIHAEVFFQSLNYYMYKHSYMHQIFFRFQLLLLSKANFLKRK
jgi:hypothetical protein